MVETLIWLIPLPPLLAFFIIMLWTNPRKALSHWVAVGAAGLSWLASMVVFFAAITKEGLASAPFHSAIDWLPLGSQALQIGIQVDPLSAVTLFFVAWTVLMIFIYSIGYHNFGQPKGEHDQPGLPPQGATIRDKKAKKTFHVPSIEPMYSRFFALISLFAFAMLVLVISDAGIKAFITTRIGDVFMLLGIVALYSAAGTLNFHEIFSNPELMNRLITTTSPVFGWSWT